MRLPILAAFAPLVVGGVLPRTSPKGALYFLDNNPAGASVVSLQIAQDGTLSNPVRTSTGGKGLYGTTATGPPGADTLFSQDSVVVSYSRLFTVSPGSNSVSLFAIPDDDPSHPVLVGSPVSSGGSFPNSVAFSHALHLACVVNTGSKAGVSCYDVGTDGLTPSGDFIPLPISQTTPPEGPPDTSSDIVFNPSSTALFVTVKGDGTDPGYIYAFPVVDGRLWPTPVVSRPADLLLDFSLSFIDDNHALITDPSYGASFVEISYPDLHVSVTKKVEIAGQKATCWSVYSQRFDAVFVFDGGNPNVTALDPATGNVKYTIPAPAATGGSLDSAVSGEFLYVLQGAAGISVFGLAGSVGNGKVPSLVQNLDLSALGSRQGWQGLAIYEY